MEIASVLLARAVAWIEPADLNPKGRTFYPDLTRALIGRYGFQKFPQKIEDFDEAKGVVFGSGRLREIVIEQLVFYTFGIAVDTRSSTDDSQHILREGLQWARELGITFRDDMLKRWQFVSNVTFYSEVRMVTPRSAYANLIERVSHAVQDATGQQVSYDLAAVTIDHDPLARKHPLGNFTIQRRDNTPYSENKYFSAAPLTTAMHIELLRQFEQDLLRERTPPA